MLIDHSNDCLAISLDFFVARSRHSKTDGFLFHDPPHCCGLLVTPLYSCVFPLVMSSLYVAVVP